MERDFVGYGPSPAPIKWPSGARIAISVVVNYEEGSEYSLLDGDKRREAAGEVASPVNPDQRDLANESMFEYGSRAGVWRILNILDENDVKCTFYGCALAFERNPHVGPEIVRRGHEVMGHGYRWEEYFNMDIDAEREAIHKAVESIARTTGERPLGWYTRYGPSLNTRELVVEEGGFVYDCNAYNDDLPYYTTVGDKKWLVIPYTLEVNDYQFWSGTYSSPDDFYSYMRSAFDRLHHEGSTHPKMMSIGLHCRMVGTPARSVALARFLEYAKQKADVWFPRRIDIARWWLQQYP